MAESETAPVTGPKKRNSTKREKTRAEIVRAAVKLTSTLTYDEMSLEAVAQAAGVSRRTIYGHFKNKADLLAAVGVDRWSMSPPPRQGDMPLEDHLRGMADGMLAVTKIRARRAHHAAAFEVYALKHEELRLKMLRVLREGYAVIEAGMDGDFPEKPLPISTAQFVRLFDALMDGLSHRRALAPEEFTDDVVLAAAELMARLARP